MDAFARRVDLLLKLLVLFVYSAQNLFIVAPAAPFSIPGGGESPYGAVTDAREGIGL